MISINTAVTETRVAEVVLFETHLSIRVGGDEWGAGLAYRAPRSVSLAGRRILIRDYLLLARLASLVLVFVCMMIRRTSR